MDTITQTNQLSFRRSLSCANLMMSNKEVPTLLVDMENVGFIDSQGLQKLLVALRLMQSQKSNLLLCSLQPSVSLVFEISRFDQMFGIFPNFDTYMNQFSVQSQATD